MELRWWWRRRIGAGLACPGAHALQVFARIERHWVPTAIHSEGAELLLLMLAEHTITDLQYATHRLRMVMWCDVVV